MTLNHDTHAGALLARDLPDSEEALLLLAKNGDQLAYAELCERHAKCVFLTILRLTKNREDAEDVLQESLMKALIHLRGFDGRSAFSTWLTRIAINSALMIKRRQRNRPEQSMDCECEFGSYGYFQIADSAMNAEDLLYVAERDSQIRRAIRALPSKLRAPIELQLAEDAPVRELAKQMGLSVSATKSRLLRARTHLRRSAVKKYAFDPRRTKTSAQTYPSK